MAQIRQQQVGTLEEHGKRPRTVKLITDTRPVLTSAEQAAGIKWVDGNYEPGNVLRYGVVNTGLVDVSTGVQNAINAVGSTGGVVFFPSGDYLLTSGVVADITGAQNEGIQFIGEGFTSGYSNSTARNGSRILLNFGASPAANSAAITVTGRGVQGVGVSFRELVFSTANADIARDYSASTVYAVRLISTLLPSFSYCSFEHLNANAAIRCDTQTNATQVDHCTFALIGDVTGTLLAVTGGYSYGRGFDGNSDADSLITNCFAEFCGAEAFFLGGNSKIMGCWADLCDLGIYLNGNGSQAIGNSVKYSQRHGTFIDANDCIVLGNQFIENNMVNAGATNYAVRLSNATNTLVNGNTAEDDLTKVRSTAGPQTDISFTANNTITTAGSVVFNQLFIVGDRISVTSTSGTNDGTYTVSTVSATIITTTETTITTENAATAGTVTVATIHTVRQDNLVTGAAGNDGSIVGNTWGTSGSGSEVVFSNSNEDSFLYENNKIASRDPHQASTSTQPNVAGVKTVSLSTAITVTDFLNGRLGQTIKVFFTDSNVTIDFTSSGLRGNAGVDWSPNADDSMSCFYDGTNWLCDISDNTA